MHIKYIARGEIFVPLLYARGTYLLIFGSEGDKSLTVTCNVCSSSSRAQQCSVYHPIWWYTKTAKVNGLIALPQSKATREEKQELEKSRAKLPVFNLSALENWKTLIAEKKVEAWFLFLASSLLQMLFLINVCGSSLLVPWALECCKPQRRLDRIAEGCLKLGLVVQLNGHEGHVDLLCCMWCSLAGSCEVYMVMKVERAHHSYSEVSVWCCRKDQASMCIRPVSSC